MSNVSRSRVLASCLATACIACLAIFATGKVLANNEGAYDTVQTTEPEESTDQSTESTDSVQITPSPAAESSSDTQSDSDTKSEDPKLSVTGQL